jgi:large subunit ribosomal protein L22
MEIKVAHRFAQISPYKARLVADLVRGASVDDAFVTLRHTRKRAASMIHKLLHSAVASAAEQHDVEPEELRIARIWVDGGPARRTWWARPRGRVAMKRHRTSHINLVLAGEADAA